MPQHKYFPFRKNLFTVAIGTLLAPGISWSLELVQEPPLPTSKSAFVAPNIVISLDDSGSMQYCITNSEAHGDNSQMNSVSKRQSKCWVGLDKSGKDIIKSITEEKSPVNGVWPPTARRINVLKYSLKNIFNDKELIPDNKIRIAWQAMNANSISLTSNEIKTNSMRPIDQEIGSGKNKTTHRDNFLKFVNELKADGGTPSHKMFQQADNYMRASINKNGPWSSDPGGTGSKSTEYLGCRRNYHILMTDGRWNGTATSVPDTNKRDNATNLTLGDGTTVYSGNESALYRDTSTGTTLADWAFYSWAVPLQAKSSLKDSNTLKPPKSYDEASATEIFESDGNIISLPKYWNPKYNPATWPHMVTYTIGFSESSYTWDTESIVRPTEKSPFGYDGSFVSLAKGTTNWPNLTTNTENNNALDLWHAALNGRGRFYAIEEGAELEQAFRDIIGKINEESAPLPDEIAAGGSASGYNVTQSNAGIFASAYSPKNAWSGYITATSAISPEEYSCPSEDDLGKTCIRFPDVTSEWDNKNTAEKLDALASVKNRVILSWSDDSASGISFQWNNFGEIQKKILLGLAADKEITTPLSAGGNNIVEYIRGDRSLEGETEEKPYRIRSSRQGDIVNSEIWYTGVPNGNYGQGYSTFVTAQKNRIPMLYVGGNDGMLHGFSAKNGEEKIAYVPRGVIGNLKELTDKDYAHRYYVDGSPMTGDIFDGSSWKTMLIGTLGAGGKGYFVLDVTNPSGFISGSAGSLVVVDKTYVNGAPPLECDKLSGTAKGICSAALAPNKDIGNITADPGRNPANLQQATQITRLNNGRWAAVMGNGYNSENQRPVLLIQYLDGDKSLQTIPATNDTAGSGNADDNGLAAPALIDLNGNGKTDIVYAGDNLGNIWKFDLTNTDSSQWKVAFSGSPLFTAHGPKTLNGTRNQIQPITAPPIVRANDRQMLTEDGKSTSVGGMMVAFGTGRNLTSDDRRTDITQNIQTIYSVLDNTRYKWNSAKTALEVHPGTSCPSGVTPCTPIPAPSPTGTMSADGAPLAKQTIVTVDGDFATVEATKELKKETWKDYKGWYLDLPYSGERLLKPMQFFDGSNILAIYTETPNGTINSESDNINESCVPVKVDTSSGSQFRTLINIMDGKRPTIQLVDFNGDGKYDADDLLVMRAPVKTGTPILITKPDRIVDLTGGGGEKDTLARMPEQSTRPSWRQLQ